MSAEQQARLVRYETAARRQRDLWHLVDGHFPGSDDFSVVLWEEWLVSVGAVAIASKAVREAPPDAP